MLDPDETDAALLSQPAPQLPQPNFVISEAHWASHSVEQQ